MLMFTDKLHYFHSTALSVLSVMLIGSNPVEANGKKIKTSSRPILTVDLETVEMTHDETKRAQWQNLTYLYSLARRHKIGLEEARIQLGKTQKLVLAASQGDLTTMRQLVRQGADINASDPANIGWTPLTIAAYNGQWAVVYVLVKEINLPPTMNLDVNKLAGPEDRSALGYAVQRGEDLIFSTLLEAKGIDIDAPEDSPPLIEAIAEGRPKMARRLLDLGAKIDLQHSGSGKTPLIYAIEDENDIPLADRLIRAGASVHLRDLKGMTALDYAQKQGLTALIKKLEAAGAGRPDLQ